ncbi:MAG: hypothetical protein ACRCZG_01205 [Culicoidibacterales bacterium]
MMNSKNYAEESPSELIKYIYNFVKTHEPDEEEKNKLGGWSSFDWDGKGSGALILDEDRIQIRFDIDNEDFYVKNIEVECFTQEGDYIEEPFDKDDVEFIKDLIREWASDYWSGNNEDQSFSIEGRMYNY